MFLRLSPAACFVAELNHEIIGTVTTVRYETQFAWIGMMLVAPAQRGQGIGKQLMRLALAALADVDCVRLDATPAGEPLYRQLGFVEERQLQRMLGRALALPSLVPALEIRPLCVADLPEVAAWDRQLFGADRQVLLAWLQQGAPEYAWLAKQDGQLAGYCCGRHGHHFEHLGPVSALEGATAQQLLHVCLSQRPGGNFGLDVNPQNAGWLDWLNGVGFEAQRPFNRMFLGQASRTSWAEPLRAILGPEFG